MTAIMPITEKIVSFVLEIDKVRILPGGAGVGLPFFLGGN